jgi:nitroreductase
MDFLELVKSRYSCRAYKPIGVEREKLDYILEVGSVKNDEKRHGDIVSGLI